MEKFETAQLDYCCSWCGRNQRHHGVRVVAGPCVFICERCIQICVDVLEEWPKRIGEKLEEGSDEKE